MKVLKDWVVTLRSTRRQQVYRKVRSCVSAQAACEVALLLYQRIPGDSQNFWRPVFAYPTNTAN